MLEIAQNWTIESNRPMPGADDKVLDIPEADWASQDLSELRVWATVGSGQWRYIDGISDRLVAGGIDHVPQSLLGILNASTFWISVSEEDQFLLLPCPKATDTFFIHLCHKRLKYLYYLVLHIRKSNTKGIKDKLWSTAGLTLITRKLRYLLLSIMILYSLVPSSRTWRRARSDGALDSTALLQAGSPSWAMTRFCWWMEMASKRTAGSSYSSGDVKWS